MPSSHPALPFQIKPLLLFPLRSRSNVFQVLMVSVLITGLQIAFFPLALILDAGYSFQVARSILCAGTCAVLPGELNWASIFRDGLRRSGIWLLFLSPGIGLAAMIMVTVFFFAAQTGLTQERLLWISALLYLGLSLALFLCLIGTILANIAAMHALVKGSFQAAFQFRGWLPILRARFAAFEITELTVFVAGIVLLMIVIAAVLPASFACIGAPFLFVATSVYLRLIATAAGAYIFRDAIIQSG